MKYKFLTRRVSMLVFDDNDPVNYVASCQININGNDGTIDTLNGKDFYKCLRQYGVKPFKELGLDEVRACVTPAHLRIIKANLSDAMNINTLGEFTSAEGIELVWISFTEKS